MFPCYTDYTGGIDNAKFDIFDIWKRKTISSGISNDYKLKYIVENLLVDSTSV